jgi:type III secretion protein Q
MTVLTRAVPSNVYVAPSRAADGVDDWLPRIAADELAPLNALHRHRRPIEAMVAEHAVTIETAARVAVVADAYAFRITLSGRPVLLRLSTSLVDFCAGSLAVRDFERLNGVRAGMLLELALLRPIKALEGRLRMEIRVEERVATIESDQQLLPLHFLVRGLPTGDAGIELLLDQESATIVARALDELAVPNAATAQLPIPLRICRGGVDLTLAELRTVRPGDILMPERNPAGSRGMIAVVGERLHFQVEQDVEGFRFGAKLTESDANAAGRWCMQDPTNALPGGPVDEAALDQVPIRVVFEIGRLDVPLAEVRRLGPGYVLPLAKPIESAVDIVANGRRIGQGSLMKIGDSIGVRIERLLRDD